MNLACQPEDDQTGTRRFVLEMLGFSAAEKAMLSSTFRLTGRRTYCYAEPAAPRERADIYLVNADNPDGMKLLRKRSPGVHAPAVLVGRAAQDDGWPLVQKPIHWMRLFEQLDRQMQEALERRAQRMDESQWDGRTLRRAMDRATSPVPVFLEPNPVESVLVVDDSATVRAFMRTRLAPFRFDVDYAENGEMAIDMAQAKRYTCIFLDILMPGMDGYQVCKRIKSSPATKGSAVVMLSSKSSAFDKFRGSWAGCDAYLGKPVSENELLATIARFLPSARRAAQSILSRPS
ncbi:MAG TPA: response regulator [Noviherbaspirillum sp.]|uniref:response regulator n=1 Tax=Noviherbaspirillum sp. TaxID=1926288 RepID=UPI002B486683|nr:response regulator [Noviherbaspirillum sp.]HJV87678.1 response regulator [Noviherbaspirillum sp.]